uniref:Delta-aminolevulinic acid dehydratase n=1 Tax=Cacopsylla melanoneura TaxID=428564 RepID=A0A8D9B6E4_9HEMI
MAYQPRPSHHLQTGYFNKTLQQWQSSNTNITPENLMLPIFVVDSPDAVETISTMPGVYRYGVNKVTEFLSPAVANGLQSILLFPVLKSLPKDETGSVGDSSDNPAIQVIPLIRKQFPSLTIACDVCLCGYTSHGHCAIFNPNGSINDEETLARLTAISKAFSEAGAHIIAPSDMQDNRIHAIKQGLLSLNKPSPTSLLSYSAKFSSAFYGPFREAAGSAPSFGDRSCYQLPCGSKGLAIRAAARDVSQGADFLMVKPGLAYLDIISELKSRHPEYPMFVYQVSGEYAMLAFAAQAGALDLRRALTETLVSFRRAGADVIISYYTPQVLAWLREEEAGKNKV